MLPIDLSLLYDILRSVALLRPPLADGRGTIYYSELSKEYEVRTGDWFEPHGSWDQPLFDLNDRLQKSSPALPPLSAVVTRKSQSQREEPGRGFWGSPGVPDEPPDSSQRYNLWREILSDVHKTKWPSDLM